MAEIETKPQYRATPPCRSDSTGMETDTLYFASDKKNGVVFNFGRLFSP